MELVSVIIPTYNRSEFLKNSIKSVLNQTYKEFEIIVIDDCSTDSTKETVESFNEKRIKYLKNKKSLKATGSRNRGIKASKGSFIAFLDDDDEWYPEKLELQLKKFKNSNVGIVYSGIELYFENFNLKYPTIPFKKGKIFKDLLKKNHIGGTVSVVIRKEALENNLFDISFLAREEYDLWIRISKQWEVEYINRPLVKAYYRNKIKRVSTNLDNYIQGISLLNIKYKKDCNQILGAKELIFREAQQYFFLGAQAIKMYDCYTARKYFFKSFKTYKSKEAFGAYILSFLGPLNVIKIKCLMSKLKNKCFNKNRKS